MIITFEITDREEAAATEILAKRISIDSIHELFKLEAIWSLGITHENMVIKEAVAIAEKYKSLPAKEQAEILIAIDAKLVAAGITDVAEEVITP